MQDVAKRLIASRRHWPEPPAPGWDRRYKARSGPPLPIATVCTDLHRVAASGNLLHASRAMVEERFGTGHRRLSTRATGHARRKRTLRWREADVRRGTGSGGLARGSLRRHRPPRLRLESLDRLDLPPVALDGPVSSRW